ncbi:MAG: IS630 family transposase [Anaerolineae bacterium]
MKTAVEGTPEASDVEQANWNWKGVHQFVKRRFGRTLSSSSCLNYLHRLDFVLKRPKKRFLKADEAKRAAFVQMYAELRQQAKAEGATIFFVDEAHFRADVDVRAKWVPRGKPALADTTSPKRGEKATYYSAVCLETGQTEVMNVTENLTAETSVAFLKQLRANHSQPLIVIWDNGPMHRGDALRTYLTTPDLKLRLVALPSYSPDFNADEAIWDWVREAVTANTCFETAAKVRAKVDAFLAGLADKTDEVKQRCRTILQSRADALVAAV